MSNLILFGFKNCGKSYWGKRLAKEFCTSFIDTDRLLEELYEKKEGKKASCSEIFKTKGEGRFRELEEEVVHSLKNKTNSVVALGGGTLLSQKNLALIQPMGLLVYLKVEKEILKERSLTQPPSAFFDQNSFDKIYSERFPFYEKIPAHTISLSRMKEDEIINRFKGLWVYGK